MQGTVLTQAQFLGQRGHTYYFRSRAFDLDHNYEAYPDGNGDAFTHIYQYLISGR